MAKQVNVFLDNRPGRLRTLTEVLHKNKINIRATTIQSREEFGLVKLLVDKPDEAHLVLQNEGFACAVKDVLAVLMKDKPGGLFALTKVLSDENVNITDAYGFVIESGKKAVFCVEVENPKKIIGFLDLSHVKVVLMI